VKKIEETLSSLSHASEQEFRSTAEAYQSPAFRSFGVAQIPTVAQVLVDIRQKEEDKSNAKHQNVAADAKLKSDLTPLKAANADIVSRQRKVEEVQSRLDKASKTAQSATEKYDKQVARNPASPETRKLMNDRDINVAKKEAIETEFKRMDEEFQRQRKVYKKQLFETLLGAFEEFARQRKESLEAQRSSAEEIGTLGASIAQYSESAPENIRAALEQLREANY